MWFIVQFGGDDAWDDLAFWFNSGLDVLVDYEFQRVLFHCGLP